MTNQIAKEKTIKILETINQIISLKKWTKNSLFSFNLIKSNLNNKDKIE